MIFSEARFLVFLAVVWTVHWTLRGATSRKAWLLAASCLFYGVCGAGFLALMLGTASADYVAGLLLARTEDPRRRKLVLGASLVANLGVLGLFKYANFFSANVGAALALAGIRADAALLDVVLPVGISFYTFQSLSYTIDVLRRRIPATRSALDFLFYVTFFPQLVAGPIVRAGEFLPQTRTAKSLAGVPFRSALLLAGAGFVKKACVADRIAPVVDGVFAAPEAFDAPSLWLADALYAVQIYCDFSGYSDMAIGLAALFGYRLPENFRFPYLAASVTDFWRRWHVTLSTWFRDYLYVPLGGNRLGAARTARNLVVVFLLCGLWHGAAWTFVLWGLVHGAALLVERAGLGAALARAPSVVGRAWTLAVVLFAWVLFRAPSLDAAKTYAAGLLGGGAGGASLASGWWLLVAAFAAAHVLAASDRLVPRALSTMPRWAFAALYGVAAALVLPWIAVGYAPFLYFQF